MNIPACAAVTRAPHPESIEIELNCPLKCVFDMRDIQSEFLKNFLEKVLSLLEIDLKINNCAFFYFTIYNKI